MIRWTRRGLPFYPALLSPDGFQYLVTQGQDNLDFFYQLDDLSSRDISIGHLILYIERLMHHPSSNYPFF
jgi:hypothetical protein